MILGIGLDDYVYKKDIISIISRECVERKLGNKEFIKGIKDKGGLIGKDDDEVNSYVICEIEGDIRVYTSIISSRTLANRTNYKGRR